jgi:hypothetical protein
MRWQTMVARLWPPQASPAQSQRQLVGMLLPALVVGVILVVLGRAEYVKHHYSSLAGFVDIGVTYGTRAGVQQLAVTLGGYDGQFNYFLARDLGIIVTCAHRAASCPLDDLGEVRVERILYPMTARLFALGNVDLLPLALLAVNFLAITLTALLVTLMSVAAGVSRWLGAAAGLFCGETLAFLRDLNDPLGVLWVVLAVYLARKGRPLVAALAVAAALLTREQLLFTLPFLALPLVAERRWKTLALSAVIALAPFVAWQSVLRVLYGSWPFISGDTHAAALVPIPFGGLWQERGTHDFKLVVVAVALPLVAAIAVAGLALVRRGMRSVLTDPVPLMALVYCILLSFTYWFQWSDLYGPARLATPGVVLALLVTDRVPRPVRAAFGVLLALTSLAALGLNARYLLHA